MYYDMNKKINPKTEFIIVRVSKKEKAEIVQAALDLSMDFSDYIRTKILK